MFQRAPKPRLRSQPIQRMVRAAEAVPVSAPTTAAALPRQGFANLAIHPPVGRAAASRDDRGNLPRRLKSGIGSA